MSGREFCVALQVLCALVLFPVLALMMLWGIHQYYIVTMPPYQNSIGYVNHTEKITGMHLLRESAAMGDNLIIFGSSELATFEIPTHPSNFFAGERGGFQVNLVGRGSCQSIIHAIAIAASGDALADSRVVIITSPQGYVPQGIAPDMFMANFSPLQFMELLAADDISPEVKQAISTRVVTLTERYAEMPNAADTAPAILWLAEHYAAPSPLTSVRNFVMRPYYRFARYLYELRDLHSSRELLSVIHQSPPHQSNYIDWEEEERLAITSAREMSDNNEFGMLNGYFAVNIGRNLHRFEGRDRYLDYSYSEEYEDLRLLFEIVQQKGIEPLFIHVPFHAQWSDFTGLTAEQRQVYYNNVRSIAQEFDIRVLDLTGYEYEEFFLCDIVHLGWRGWLRVAKSFIEFYHGY